MDDYLASFRLQNGVKAMEIQDNEVDTIIRHEPLAYRSNPAPEIRVGEQYQAIIPPFQRPPFDDKDDDHSMQQSQPEPEPVDGKAVWLASRMKQTKSVDTYLQFVQTLFTGIPRYYSQEKALFFLHQVCHHSTAHSTLYHID